MKFNNIELPYNFKEYQDHGLTNDLFILNDQFFVKRSRTITKNFLNWENQLNVISLIKSQPFTLPILDAQISEEKLWILMPYYQNLSTLSQNLINQELLQQLAKLVQQLHDVITENNQIVKWNPIEQLNKYCNLFATTDEKVLTIKNDLTLWFKTYQPKTIVLSHNDLVLNNFVCHENKWYLIDWDFATLNDHLFDVASFASETLKNQLDISYWYQLFNLSEDDLKIVNYWIKYQNLIWYHWAMFLHQKTNTKIYQTIAEEKLKMLLN